MWLANNQNEVQKRERQITKREKWLVGWFDLPEELLNKIAAGLFSNIELKRFRSICKSWHSFKIYNNNLFQNDLISSLYSDVFLTRTTFFRVTLSSSSSQGWLIKSDVDFNSGKFHLLDPLSGLAMRHSCKSLNLLDFTFTEIQEAYVVQPRRNNVTAFRRVVFVNGKEGDHQPQLLGVSCYGSIMYWDDDEWKILKQMADKFSDVIVHKGLTYALDTVGSVWWISYALEVHQYGPSLDDDTTNGYSGDKRFVECCGELYIVDRLCGVNPRKRRLDCLEANEKTSGFKVYKMDEELGKMIEVKSLKDNAFVMANDTCFSVSAQEFYGCLKNSIYFVDHKDKDIKVFKLSNAIGSIETMSKFSKSSFQMFFPSFL